MSDDQKAMLRLLAQREQGYKDMAALMGLSVEEVRAKVKEALAELEQEEAPAAASAPVKQEASPEPPPPPPTPPVPPAVSEPTPAEPAKPAAEPAAPGPAETPTAQPVAKPAQPKAQAAPPSPKRPRPALPKDRGALIGLGAGAAAVLLIVVLLVSGVLGDDSGSDSGENSSSVSTQAPENVETGGSRELTQAILDPTDGGDASGRALFGRFKKNVLLQVEAEGLEPSPEGESYTVWLYRSPKVVLRVGAVKVNDSEGITAQFPIPAQLLAYVANGAFDQIDISLTEDAAYKAEVARAKAQKRLPAYMGTSVMRGEITGPSIKG